MWLEIFIAVYFRGSSCALSVVIFLNCFSTGDQHLNKTKKIKTTPRLYIKTSHENNVV